MTARADAVMLAHQGGWDEILMVLVPLALFGGLLMLANRRAERLGDDVADPDATEVHAEGSAADD